MSKIGKEKNIRKIKVTPQVVEKYKEMNKEKISKKKLGNYIIDFIYVIERNFSKEDLEHFYQNINSVKVKRNLFTKATGSYSPAYNRIFIKRNCDYAIFHELFHLASTTVDNEDMYVGFCQMNDKNFLGIGLNEGYTEALTRRYFEEFSNKTAYNIEVDIALSLEKIIGKEKMESLYMQSNLKGLVTELQKYSSNNDIMKFIGNVDYINKFHNDKDLVVLKLEEVSNFLKDAYINKLRKEADIIDLEDIVIRTIEFSNKTNNINKRKKLIKK